MITEKQLAEIINDKLNDAAKATGAEFEFKVFPNLGDYQASIGGTRKTLPKPLVNATLISTSSQIVPLQNVKSYTVTHMLNILAPVDREKPEEGIGAVMEPVRYFVEQNAGLTKSLKDDDGNVCAFVFAPQFPNVGQLMNGIGVWYVPVTLFLIWQFIENGVVSNEIGITIDGQSAVLLNGGSARTRITETNSLENDEEMTTIISQQGLTLKVTTPYIKTKGSVSRKLVNDAWNGALGTFYNVTYRDGTDDDDTAVTKSVKMVATEISENWASGTVVSVTATLVPADNTAYTNKV